MTTPRPPHEDDEFRQLTGAFDRPIAPSPRFAESLKARLEREVSERTGVIPTAAPPISQRTVRATSGPTVTRRRWVDVAIAATLIVAMLAGSIWYADVRVGDDGPGAPEASRYAAQPLASDATPATDSLQLASNPGNINAWPAGFDPEADLERTTLAGKITYPSYAVIAGDTMIVQGNLTASGEKETNSIVAIDIETGAIRWNVPLTAKREFVTDGMSIFGFFSNPGRTEISLMAIDVEDGESRWHGPTFNGEDNADLLAPVESMNLFGPTLVDDQLFFRTPEGDIVALNAETGEQQWSLASEGPTAAQQPLPGSLVSDGQYLYEIDRERSLRQLSVRDGTMVERIEPELEKDEFLSWIFATTEELLVVSQTRGFDPQHLHVLSTASSEVLWTLPLGEVRPYMTVTGEVVAVPHYVPASIVDDLPGPMTDEGLHVSFLDLQSGAPVFQYGPSAGDLATLSSSGDVVCINEGVTVTCLDTASETSSPVTLPYAPGEGHYDPVAFWDDVAIINGGDDGIVLLSPKNEQPQGVSAPAPGDPGNTNAYPEAIDLAQAYTAESFGDVDIGANEMLVVGDALVYVGGKLMNPESLAIANPALTSRDLATGKLNWSYKDPSYGPVWPQQIATDGEHVYAVLYNPNLPTTYRLIALDGATGEVLWQTERLHEIAGVEPSERYSTGKPVAVSGLVLVSYGPEILLALDGDTGETAWTLRRGEGASLDPEDMYLPASPVVANETSVFRGLPDGSVEEIELATGEVQNAIPGPEEDGLALNMSLHQQGDYLVVKREMVPSDEDARSTIDVHNIATGGGWTVDTSSSFGAAVVTPDTLVVTEYVHREPDLLERILPFVDVLPEVDVMAFDLETGEEVELLRSDDNLTSLPAISAAGDTVCMAGETVRCMNRDGNEMVVDGYEVESFMPGNPPVYWNGHVIIGNGSAPLTIAKPGP